MSLGSRVCLVELQPLILVTGVRTGVKLWSNLSQLHLSSSFCESAPPSSALILGGAEIV
jgi:hypothetical protein